MGRLVRDDRKATVTQITTRYNQGMQNTSLNAQHIEPWSRWATAAEDHTGCRSCQLRTGNGGYNPHRLTKIGKTLPVLMSLDLCCNVQMVGWEFGVKNMKAWIHPVLSQWFRLVVVVWGIFSWHTLGPFVPIEHCLNTTAYLSIVADHVHPFMTTVYPSSDGYFQQDNAPCHKAQIISDWFLEHEKWFHFTQMASTVTRSQSIKAPLGCSGTGDLHHGCTADKSAAAAWCYYVNMEQNLEGMFPTPCWIYDT